MIDARDRRASSRCRRVDVDVEIGAAVTRVASRGRRRHRAAMTRTCANASVVRASTRSVLGRRARRIRRATRSGAAEEPPSEQLDAESLRAALENVKARLRQAKASTALAEAREHNATREDIVAQDDAEIEPSEPERSVRRVVDWFGEVTAAAVRGLARDELTSERVGDDAEELIEAKGGDATRPRSTGGWFEWTNGWRVVGGGSSSTPKNVSEDVGAAMIAVADAAASVDQASSVVKKSNEDDSTNFLQRVPLPPWIRQGVFGTRVEASSPVDEMAYETSMTTSEVNNAIRDANETAANVTSAALEKLNSVLIGIEQAELRVEKDARFGKDAVALRALRESLRDARTSANEAREAAGGLEAAVREVNRAQAAIRSEAGAKGEDALRALEIAKDAVIKQAASSNNAVADALRQVSYVATRVERLGFLADDEDATGEADREEKSKESRRGLLGAIANARESAQDALVASELTQTIARLMSFGADKSRRVTDYEELSTMVKPALQKVVANALRPVGDDDINAARLACALSAWVYYLPQMQHALPRNRLRLITSSLDVEKVIPSSDFRAGKLLMEKAEARAEQDFEEEFIATRLAATKEAKREMSAINAAAEAASLAASALEFASELRAEAEDEETVLNAIRMAENATKLAIEAQKNLEEAKAIAKQNKQMLDKWKLKCELAQLESQMRKTVAEQQRKKEAERIRQDRIENASLPVNFCVAAQDETATLWVVVEGSTNFVSWQANLTFQQVVFEDAALGVQVHRGAYTAAQTMYRRVEEAVKEHVAKHGARARVRITGHSIGGSIAMLLAFMLLIRNGAPRYALADVWCFGAPYVTVGGDALLARLGLPRSFIRSVVMGDDIVPRSFSCYYPQWARSILDSGPFNVDVSGSNFLEEDMFYTPTGSLFMLQASNGEHSLLPTGPGLYCLDGDGLFENLSARARLSDDEDGEESWLNRRPMAPSDDSELSDEPAKAERLRLHQLACLTQSDAALTASLILSTLGEEALLDADGGVSAALSARSRDAAQRVLMNTPHPLTILSKPGAYGDHGIISRHHNPFNYSKALSNARKTRPVRSELAAQRARTSIDGAPASGNGPR